MLNLGISDHRYWIGFLLADGCVMVRKRKAKEYPLVSVDVGQRDAEHLQLIKETLGGKTQKLNPLRNNFGTVERSRWWLYSSELVRDLEPFGVVPRKTGKEFVHPDLEHDPDFWRGVIDGDGCVRMRGNYPVIMLGAPQRVCESFLRMASDLGVDPAKITKTGAAGLKQTGWLGSKARWVIRHLYNRPGPVLARKREAIASIL